MKKNIWLDGMMGLVVGDALGVPVQFMTREEIKNRPEGVVTGMEVGGIYNMPEGTWSDDSSMALATLASIIEKKEANPADIMMRFVKWELNGEYTPFGAEMVYLGRLFHLLEFRNVPEEEIRTTGYVIDSIEAAVWCLLTTDSYKDCMLRAVNLGDDTDTVAAIAGGLAGLYYGYEAIPMDWLAVIKKYEWIEQMCEGLE